MLFGERPFWWIGESHLFDNKQPKVLQFPATCETGPGESLLYQSLTDNVEHQANKADMDPSGSPSGHAMVTAAAWWVMVSSLGSFLYLRTRRYAH